VGQPHLPPPPLLDPAWYPDPTGRYEARYWDGRKWTSHISHYGATGADPLLRARWDRWWIRGFFRLAMWAAIAGAGYWAYDNYWPDNERDYEADEQLASAAILSVSDMPGDAWLVSTTVLGSPLGLPLDEEGAVEGFVECAGFGLVIEDGLDEPRRLNSFATTTGDADIAHSVTIAADPTVGRNYLTQMRQAESGACLGLLWSDVLGQSEGQLELSTAQAMNDPAFGDEAVWWRLDGILAGGGRPVEVFLDYVVVRVDRVLVEYAFAATADTVPVDLQRDVIQIETARVRDLLSAIVATEESDEAPDGTADDE